MACICQYLITSRDRDQKSEQNGIQFIGESKSGDKCSDHPEKDVSSGRNEVSASELASATAEIWVLRKKLTEAEISIESLENVVRAIIGKQNELMCELYELKSKNIELRDECRLQRDYHTVERNAMIQELHNLRSLLNERSRVVEETMQKNAELTDAVQDANEKIYMMGMKFLKLQQRTKARSSARSSTSDISASLSYGSPVPMPSSDEE